MRGKGVLVLLRCDDLGITPAYAGKRDHEASGTADKRDHPRLCGEKLVTETFSHSPLGSPPPMRGKGISFSGGDILCIGSPPPMRGKGPVTRFKTSSQGITPAYAGKSHLWKMPASRVQDHPRLCGEKLLPEFGCS